jgi:hypothetical protein
MLIDPRGPRFAATLTTVVLAVVLLVAGSPLALLLLGFQASVFAIGAVRGPQSSPYGRVFRGVVRPRLGPPSELEDSRPPRFAQTVGLAFAVAGWFALALGAVALGSVIVSLALAAAFLNAAFNFCLGCEIYLIARRAGLADPLVPLASVPVTSTQLGKEAS